MPHPAFCSAFATAAAHLDRHQAAAPSERRVRGLCEAALSSAHSSAPRRRHYRSCGLFGAADGNRGADVCTPRAPAGPLCRVTADLARTTCALPFPTPSPLLSLLPPPLRRRSLVNLASLQAPTPPHPPTRKQNKERLCLPSRLRLQHRCVATVPPRAATARLQHSHTT
jgi:hypothetical protein